MLLLGDKEGLTVLLASAISVGGDTMVLFFARNEGLLLVVLIGHD